MNGKRRANEMGRREIARSNRGRAVKGSGRALEGRDLPQMLSVRLSGDLVSALRAVAADRSASVSELIREGAAIVVTMAQSAPYWVVFSRVDNGSISDARRYANASSSTASSATEFRAARLS